MRNLVLLVLCLASTVARAEQRVALVIGNGAYASVPALPNPASDARAVAERLRGLNFGVTILIDADKRTMDEALRAFGRGVAGADVAMVFYAGHGVQVDGRNYLMPVDARLPQRAQDLRYDFVDVASVMDELSGARRLRLVVLDACRDNPVAAQLTRSLGRSLGGTRGLAAPADMDNTLIAYATAAEATAADGDGAHSPFTQALLDHIGDPGLDVRLMFGRVRDAVRHRTNNRQLPFVYVSMGGDSFAFNPGPASPTSSAPGPSTFEPAIPTIPKLNPPMPTISPSRAPDPPRPIDLVPILSPGLAPDMAQLLEGRWRHADRRDCGGGLFGTVTLLRGALRFEWRLPGGRLNVAVERIISVEGNMVSTVVISDVGTPQPETGHRNRYTIEPSRWVSQSLTTGERAVHVRC